jgi:hypothetical protein
MTLPTQTLQAACAALALCCTTATSAAALAPPGPLADWTCTGVCGSSAADGDIGLSPLGNPLYGYVATAGSTARQVSPLALDPNSRGDGTEANGSRLLSGAFAGAAGDTLSMRFNYLSTDGKGFDDYAWARLVHAGDGSLAAWLFTARSSNSSTGQIVPGDVVDKEDFDFKAVIVDYDSFIFTSKTSADPLDWSLLGGSNQSCWRDNAAGCGYTGWLQSQVTLPAAGLYRVELGVVNWGDEAYDSGLAFDFAGLQGAAPVPEPATGVLTAAGLALLAGRLRRPRAGLATA